MEVGVLSGIATTQNADTDEGAEAQMSLSLRRNFYSEICASLNTVCDVSVPALVLETCVLEVCSAFGNILHLTMFCIKKGFASASGVDLSTIECFVTNSRRAGITCSRIFRRLKDGDPFPPALDTIQNMKPCWQYKTTSLLWCMIVILFVFQERLIRKKQCLKMSTIKLIFAHLTQ